MINRLKYATIADIGVYDLVFYDESKVEEKLLSLLRLQKKRATPPASHQ